MRWPAALLIISMLLSWYRKI